MTIIKLFQSYNESTLDSFVEIVIELLTIYYVYIGFTEKEAASFFRYFVNLDLSRYTIESSEMIKKIYRRNYLRNKPEILNHAEKILKSINEPYQDESWKMIWQNTIEFHCQNKSDTLLKSRDFNFPIIYKLISHFGMQNNA